MGLDKELVPARHNRDLASNGSGQEMSLGAILCHTRLWVVVWGLTLFFSMAVLPVYSLTTSPPETSIWTQWSDRQYRMSAEKIWENIRVSRELHRATPGAVVASNGTAQDHQRGEHQSYRFHWKRDAAFVMMEIAKIYRRITDPALKAQYKAELINYAEFCRKLQSLPAKGGLGEPKFFLDGGLFNDEWGRPQNDGPAVEALTLLAVARIFAAEGDRESASRLLSVVRPNLDYVAANYEKRTFDIWEWNLGVQYPTLVWMEAALREWTEFAARHPWASSGSSSIGYAQAAEKIAQLRAKFWQPGANAIAVSLGEDRGAVKQDRLDTAVLIAVLYSYGLGEQDRAVIRASDEKVLATAERLRAVFEKEYVVNRPGSAFLAGRYPGDDYFSGNPWALTSAAFAELYDRVAIELRKDRVLKITPVNQAFYQRFAASEDARQRLTPGATFASDTELFRGILSALLRESEAIGVRIGVLTGPGGDVPEQFARVDGRPVGLPNLTWSQAAMLRAIDFHRLAQRIAGAKAPGITGKGARGRSCQDKLTVGANS